MTDENLKALLPYLPIFAMIVIWALMSKFSNSRNDKPLDAHHLAMLKEQNSALRRIEFDISQIKELLESRKS